MLRKLLNDYRPEHMAVVFDAPGRTFRNDLFAEYKAHRPPTPEDLKIQIPLLYEIVRAMGLPLLMVEDVEADDVIGTLATQASASSMQTLISTGDKDMAQLVDEHVTLINTMSNTAHDRQGVINKYGVAPEQIVDYLALMGDTADNIPGVHKCGPKTAAKWLAEYGSLDEVMSHAHEIKGKVGEYLREALQQLPLSQTLTTIKTDVELGQQPHELRPQAPDVEKLREIYSRIEASRLLQSLEEGSSVSSSDTSVVEIEVNYATVFQREDFLQWLNKLESAELFAFDTETTSLNYMQAELVGLSFSIAEERLLMCLWHTVILVPRINCSATGC